MSPTKKTFLNIFKEDELNFVSYLINKNKYAGIAKFSKKMLYRKYKYFDIVRMIFERTG